MVPPPALVNAWVAVVSLFIVITLPAVPETVNVVTVWVVPAVNKIEWAAEPSSLKSANVLLPAMVLLAVLAPRDHQILLKVFPPPEKIQAVLLVSVNLMVEVLAFKVRFVVVAVVQVGAGLCAVVIVHVPEPMVIVLLLELLESQLPKVRLLLFASKVPLFKVAPAVTVKLSCSVKVPPTI